LARRNLPPLRALTAFEAAARLGSFRKAADELGITRSAISHQIKALEDILGVDLFSRDGKRAELTGPGLVYYPAVREAFDQIESQTQVIRPRASENELTVQVYVTVAMKWLLPRLHDFERRYPNMKVRLSTSYFHWDYDPDNADVGVILARNREDGHHYANLFRSQLRPVCSPDYLARSAPLERPEDLVHHKLLYVFSGEEDWRTWLKAAGVADVKLSSALAFDSYLLAQEAAVAGQGVAMTIGPFARDELAGGRLVYPFRLSVPHRHWWAFACKSADKLLPKVRLFHDWVREQVQLDDEIEAATEAASKERVEA
jgi:LysR family transcriptional regulator, glycine cleavage system transcriptional activator